MSSVLLNFRLTHGLSQQQAATLFFCTQATISRWEITNNLPVWAENLLQQYEEQGVDAANVPRKMPKPNKKFLCQTCHKPVSLYIPPPGGKRKNPPEGRFCNRTCAGKWRRKENHPQWRGGKSISNDYVFIHAPEHPSANMRGYVPKHRLVMEKHLGRYLKPGEVVHHKNDNPRDNRLRNLQLLPSQSEHKKIHDKNRKRDTHGRYLPIT